jgi:hypothetical protein
MKASLSTMAVVALMAFGVAELLLRLDAMAHRFRSCGGRWRPQGYASRDPRAKR